MNIVHWICSNTTQHMLFMTHSKWKQKEGFPPLLVLVSDVYGVIPFERKLPFVFYQICCLFTFLFVESVLCADLDLIVSFCLSRWIFNLFKRNVLTLTQRPIIILFCSEEFGIYSI